MSTDRSPLFCDIALAERIERAEVELVVKASEAAHLRNPGGGGFVIPVGGGAASFAEADSPFNKVVGLGFAAVPSAADLDGIERAFATLGAPVQIELAHLADPDFGEMLTGRGYLLVSFENVLGRALTGVPAPVAPVAPPGIEIQVDGDLQPWLDVVIEGVAQPDTQGVPSHEEFPTEIVEKAERDMVAAGAVIYTAVRDGVVAGGASMRISDGVAALTGAATAPAHRRRGIQSALLAARLADAVASGCDVAVVTTQPGSKSHQNVQRQGFDLLYTRAILVKSPTIHD